MAVQSRNLNIHEYQSQDLMRKYGISVPEGGICTTPDEAYELAQKLGEKGMLTIFITIKWIERTHHSSLFCR